MFKRKHFERGQSVNLNETVYIVVDVYDNRSQIPDVFQRYTMLYDAGQKDKWYLLSSISDGPRIVAPESYLQPHNFPLFTTLN